MPRLTTTPSDALDLDLFDIDSFEEGVLIAAAADRFAVAWGETVAEFDGAFLYPPEGGFPVAGEIAGYRLSEGPEVEIALDGLSVRLEDLLAAMAADEGEDLEEEQEEDESGDGDDVEEESGPPREEILREKALEAWLGEIGDGASFFREVFAGHDRMKGGDLADVVRGFAGRDRIEGRGGDDRLDGGDGRDRLFGGEGDDEVSGGDGADRVDGNGGADIVLGGGGSDRLFGGAGDDFLEGGLGRDRLFGGAGADVFDFDAVEEFGARGRGDQIRDFAVGEDVVDLSDIDADRTAEGDQDFVFVGRAAFSGVAGELQMKGRKLKGDCDGDGAADFVLKIGGDQRLDAEDFIL